MRKLGILSAVMLTLICAAGSSAEPLGMGMFALLRPTASAVPADGALAAPSAGDLASGDVASGAPQIAAGPEANGTSSAVRVFQDRHLPVRLRAVRDGMFVPAREGDVLIVRDGQVVRRSVLGTEGTVQLTGLDPGPYSLLINGADGFAAFAAWVSPFAGFEGGPGEIIDVGLVPQVDMPTVRGLLDASSSSPPVGPADELIGDETGRLDTLGDRHLIHGWGFELLEDGTVQGRVARVGAPDEEHVPLPGMNVYFVQANSVVAQAVTNAQGLFQVGGLHPGIYDFVSSGPDGFVAVSVEVQPGPPPVAAREFEPVAFNSEPVITTVQANPVPPRDLNVLPELLGTFGRDGLPIAGAGDGGMAFGGGGGAAGGGGMAGGDGFGTLLGLGALGLSIWAISEALDDDDGFVSPGSP